MKISSFTAVFTMAFLFLVADSVRANHQLAQGYVVLKVAGGDACFFDTDYPTANPDFTNTVAVVFQGTSIRMGGEAKTSPCCGDPQGAEGVALIYGVDTDPTNSLSLPYNANASPYDKWQPVGFTRSRVAILPPCETGRRLLLPINGPSV